MPDPSNLSNHAVEEYPTDNGPADYALFVQGKLLGIIEAKKVSISPQNVLEQAKRYSHGCKNTLGEWHQMKVPFLYSSNGAQIWFADIREDNYSAREISSFHSPNALEDMFQAQMSVYKDWFRNHPIDFDRLRMYQKDAIGAIENSLQDNRRKMMLAMATGTGKTFTAVSMIYRMLKSGYARRILFLVDRRALAAQAAVAFAAFQTPSGNKFNQEYEVYSQRFQKEDFDEEHYDISVLPNQYLTNPNQSQTFVYVCTIQRMAINLFGRENSFVQPGDEPEIEEGADLLPIPNHAFDIIIADECHRGYTPKDTSVWRNTLDHFDAVKIGLTATPAAHTVAYFGSPVFRYTYEQAVLDGFLVDYEAVKIKSDVRIKGIFLKEGEKVGLRNTETGTEMIDALEDEREFDASEVERKITSPDSNRKIIHEIANYAREHQEKTGHFPKTLIFASNDIQHISHADQLVRLARDEFNQGDDFVQKITGNPSVDRPLEKIRRFRNRPEPAVVVTVDMLSTGVDIPALEYIVFLRPVKSRILWTQMLGRGTRKCPDINKECFTIFDCFDGSLIDYFKDTSDFCVDYDESGVTVTIAQIIENIWNNVEPEFNKNRLIKRLRRISDTMSGKAREDFAAFIPEGNMGKFADNLKAELKSNFDETMKLLRDKAFQALLVNYERAKDPFYISYAPDNVESEVVFRVGDQVLKPPDYLDAFALFIHENKDKIEALSILLNKPRQWSFGALQGIRDALKRNSFEEKEVQKAHARSGHKAMADIISMIKNAENYSHPLYTAEERVNRVIGDICQGFAFNSEQLLWLGYIGEHLKTNLALEKGFFNTVPIFTRNGGLTRARQVFGPQLDQLINEINFKITA